MNVFHCSDYSSLSPKDHLKNTQLVRKFVKNNMRLLLCCLVLEDEKFIWSIISSSFRHLMLLRNILEFPLKFLPVKWP